MSKPHRAHPAQPVVPTAAPSAGTPPPPLPDAIPDPGFDDPEDAGAADGFPVAGHIPFPVEIPQPFPRLPLPVLRRLRHGCYLLRYTPALAIPGLHYDGTLRVERNGATTTASGDLYTHQPGLPPFGIATPEPSPAAGIPIFPRARYRYYVRVTQVLQSYTVSGSFTLRFQLHRFDHATRAWTAEPPLSARMAWTPAPAGYPSAGDYLTGTVKNGSGTVTGTLTMGWVSPYLRRAVLEIDRVNGCEAPRDNGAGVGWRALFDAVGWDLTVVESETNIPEASGASWSNAEMHSTMLARRAAASLDREWRYHLLCVRLLDETERGIMYDAFGTDSNNVPREGAGISAHWMVPNQAVWGRIRNTRFGASAPAYFRTAVHEIGHALGLFHNTADLGIMNTTDVIALAAVAPQQFPDNIGWAFAPDDGKRLRHIPDIFVRPGGVPFGASYAATPISDEDLVVEAVGLELRVTPVLESVPLGAPVRLELELVNVSGRPLPAPKNLSLKSDFVRGRVVDPSGTVRTFSPVVRCIEDHPTVVLQPGERVENSLTLLRGGDGALFPMSGAFQVVVEAEWDVEGTHATVSGAASVMVTPAVDADHAATALRVISTPDALLTLVIGGDHLDDGVEAIRAALANPVLRPHFAVIEAKRLGRRFFARKPDLRAASALLADDAVLSRGEVRSTARLMHGDQGPQKGRQELARRLKIHISAVQADDETVALINDAAQS